VRNSLEKDRIQAVCFDIDGTLADTDDAYVRQLAIWLKPFRRLLPRRDVQGAARRIVMALESPANAFVAMLDKAGLDQIIGPAIDFLYQLRGAKPARGMNLIPGTRDSLRILSQRYRLAIATAREQRSANAFLQEHDLASYFACVASARSARRAKPHPAPIRWIGEQLRVDPQDLLMVGDTVVDVHAGRSAGAQTVGVLSGFGLQKELEAADADAVFDCVANLTAWLVDEQDQPKPQG
jgi:phosphoglycolate phosphatase-like HAD superfamily hydrolase